ncbi:type II secretion system protein GspL [Vibrio hannami]|uniref:type II secretion system protein GspL n=1 Tax=Vibrio hannami TaxID=2717094 RepID=UPI00240EFBBC|nr:type II secretion system protein GspL [Vibrio hannami]MDG3086860.1 type II secretion system protein GspL [Vibrio hannami]
MSEFLTVRLSRQEEKPIGWLVWSTSQNEIIASGELSDREQLEELTDYAQQRTTILLLDSSDLILSDVDVPAGAAKQLDKMLPYIMEEDIAQNVESLHFHILKKTASIAYVAAVERDYLQGTLDRLNKLGIEVKKVLPDVLALPYSEDAISAAQLGDQWLFRKGEYQGLALESAWLPHFEVSGWNSDGERVIPVNSYTPAPTLSGESLGWQEKEPELVMQLLAKGAIFSGINILSGSFKPQSAILKNLKVWKGAAIAACLLLMVMGVKNYVDVSRAEVHASAYRAESERIFRSIFPDKQRIPTVSYLKREMDAEESRLSGSGSEDTVLSWLASLPAALENKKDIDIKAIRFDAKRGEMRIEAQMADFQAFEVVKTELEEHFSVTQGPLGREGEKVSGSFVLRRQE